MRRLRRESCGCCPTALPQRGAKYLVKRVSSQDDHYLSCTVFVIVFCIPAAVANDYFTKFNRSLTKQAQSVLFYGLDGKDLLVTFLVGLYQFCHRFSVIAIPVFDRFPNSLCRYTRLPNITSGLTLKGCCEGCFECATEHKD